jgi:hypothetical protein
MPEITAQGKVFRDWEGLLGACAQNASLLPGTDALKTELETLLAQARELKIQQENLAGNKNATTQRLAKTIDDGREVARKLRAQVVVNLGTDSKHLSQFGVAPRQKKPRKTKTPAPPPPTVTPEPPKPPTSSGNPSGQ